MRKGLRARLPAELRGFELMRGHSRLLKLHYGHPELHFEGTAQQNVRAFDFFREHMVEVKAALRRAELEPWDRGWSRLYETLPATVLDERVMTSAVDLMHDYITVLQPLVVRFLDEAV